MQEVTFTPEELVNVMTQLKGTRQEAVAVGKKYGLPAYRVDMFRTMLGYTRERPEPRPQELKDKVIELYDDNPESSAYSLFQQHKEELPGVTYQYFYKIVRDSGRETNRKRNFWTPIKDKRLIYLREEKKMTFVAIAEYFGRKPNIVQLHYSKLKKREVKKNET